MAQLLSSATCTPHMSRLLPEPILRNSNPSLVFFQKKCSFRAGRVFCLFSNGRKKEEARKALENALSQKKDEFEKWNKQIEKRELEREGGGGTGQGGWFGGGGWFGWFGGDQFWEEAKQAIIVIVGLISAYLLLTKGEAISAVVFNSLLVLLRKIRGSLDYIFSLLSRRGQVPVRVPVSETVNNSYQIPTSAKERVVKKWGMD
ncbi:hypothetical protein LUZ61_021317 [Rhynchospora tenuis]|uniref:Uncharacterized protein n=1 Tax=Rhynchospora tenuis TaxID=198213 RepID=A0AAD5W7V8_9POAL|nr:hypothetical protein LUZ61_021317 [Rhynchospora tenuis]